MFANERSVFTADHAGEELGSRRGILMAAIGRRAADHLRVKLAGEVPAENGLSGSNQRGVQTKEAAAETAASLIML